MSATDQPYIEEQRYLDSRPFAARALYVLALVVVLTVSAIWLYRFASLVTDENLYDDIDGQVTIVVVDEGGVSERAGLKVGDVIMAINGHPVEDKFEANDYLVEGTKGKVLEYTILRDGEQLFVKIELAEFGMPIFYLALVLTGMLFVALGAFVFLRRPTYPVARLFGWATLLMGYALIMSRKYNFWFYPDILSILGSVLEPFAWLFAFSLFLHLFLLFPVRRFDHKLTWKEFVLIYVVVPGITFLLVLFNKIVFPQSFLLGLAQFLMPAITISAAVLYLERTFKPYYNPEYKQKSTLTKAAIIAALLFFAGMTFAGKFSSWQVVFLLFTGVPVLLFLAIIRHRIFDLYIVVRKSSLYTTLTLMLGVFSVTVFFFVLYILPLQDMNLPVIHLTNHSVEIIRLHSMPESHQTIYEKRMFLTAGVLLFFVVWWGYKLGRRYLDEKFYRGSYDYRRALQDFGQLSRRYSDTTSLATTVVEDLAQIMFLKGAVFAIRNGRGFMVIASRGMELEDDAIQVSLDENSSFQKLMERGSSQAIDNLDLGSRYQKTGIEFITPVIVEDRIEALILCGGKQAETNFTREDVDLLDNLAINVADALTTMSFYEGTREKERLMRELEIARNIQLSALPTDIPDLPGIDMAAESIPALEVGGDFYDFLTRHDSTTFIIGDVSGKGTSAALYLARIQGIIKTIDSYQPSLWELFVRINTQIFYHVERQTYLTLAGLNINFLSGKVSYLRAGHLPLLHYNSLSREVVEYQPTGLGIGLDHNLFGEELREEEIFTRSDDVLLMLTDGVTEAENAEREQYGIERAATALRELSSGSAEEIKQGLLASVDQFSGGVERHDDATVIVVKFSTGHPS